MNDQQQSRADALTKLVESYGHALIKQRNEEASAILEMIHRFAASSAEHPAAAPIIPTPADKRAAFEAWWTRDVPIEYRSMLPLLLQRNAKGEYDNPRCEGAWEIWQASAAASPAAEAVAYVCSASNDFAPIVRNKDSAQRLSDAHGDGKIVPLYAAPQPAQADAPAEVVAIYQVQTGDAWLDMTPDQYARHSKSRPTRIVYTAPPAARAASPTDEQRESIEHAARWLAQSEDLQNKAHAKRLRALLNGADR